uniref:Uncharacterized protein n=1 Tax=Rhizophora mucronata TaxID=61149 RepID=A0A2P2IIX5_RHIMU
MIPCLSDFFFASSISSSLSGQLIRFFLLIWK